MLPIDDSGLAPMQEPTWIRPFETKDWVTNISVIIEKDNKNIPDISFGTCWSVYGYES